MSRREYEECANCDMPLDGIPRHSLPVGNNADFVAVTDTTTEWAGVPSCDMCYALHAAAGDNGPAVLKAYAEQAVEMVDRVTALRGTLREIKEATEEALHATR